MLMAPNLSFGNASSLLHQLENDIKRDNKMVPSQSGISHSQEHSTQEQQRTRCSASYPPPSMASNTAHLRLSQPTMSMLEDQNPILPPLNPALINAQFLSSHCHPISHERWGEDREGVGGLKRTLCNPPSALPLYRTPSSPSPRRRTPSALGRPTSSANSRVEGRGRISKGQRRERPIVEERSWFDADGDGKSIEEQKELSPPPKAQVSGIKRKEVPARVRPPPLSKRFPAATPLFTLEDQIADILSTFEGNTHASSSFSDLTSEFHDPLEDTQLSAILNSSTSPSLPATIYSLAVSNPSFFQTLREAVPPEYCAISFFKRIEAQVYAIGRRHSDYLFAGASLFDFSGRGDRLSGLGRTLDEHEEMSLPDAKWCEAALKRRVNTIRRHLEIRKPLGRGAKEQAMRVLVRILWEVTEKGDYEGRDAMGTSSMAMDAQRSRSYAPTQNIGVYGRLIGKAGALTTGPRTSGSYMYGTPQKSSARSSWSSSAAPEGHEDSYFIIDALWELVDCSGPSINLLRKILGRIKMFEARAGYTDELERFLKEAERRNSGAGARGDVSMGDQELVMSRRSSVDSMKRARESNLDELERDRQREVFKRRVT